MKRIAQSQGIEIPVTTYSARHSFATVLKRSGASLTNSSAKSLDTADLRTTENYLDSFEDDIQNKYTKELTNF